MRISDLIKMGLKNLFRRKARTALTIVGVVIGTISIIVMVSIGIGMNASYEKQIMESGSLTTIYVSAREYVEQDDSYSVKQQELNDTFIEQVAQLDHVKAVTPFVSRYLTLESGSNMGWAQLYAFDTSSMAAFEFPAVVSGLTPSENEKDIFLYGSDSLSNFYSNHGMGVSKTIDPDQNRIKMEFEAYEYNLAEGKKPFNMTIKRYGVLEKSNDYEYDYAVFVDLEYYKKIFEKFVRTLTPESRKMALKSLEKYDEVRICVDSVRHVDDVQDQIEDMGYMTRSLQSATEPIKQASNMLQLVLGCIGGVSMLVSAISIANTMIMSIYERTKEIGVMKVLGCFVKDIKKLFLFESAMIGLMGGLIGVGLSFLASWAINKYGGPVFEAMMQTNYMYDSSTAEFSLIPFWLPIAALLFAMLIGIISGYYPARRATRISAIEAMKTEN